MPITSLAQYMNAPKQYVRFAKTNTAVAANWVSPFAVAGSSTGVLTMTNTNVGLVPVAGGTGYPPISSFNGLTGYITKIEFTSSAASGGYAPRFILFDTLFAAGSYARNANLSLSSQPSFLSRIPDGDYSCAELWIEQNAAATGIQTVAFTYLDGLAVTQTNTAFATAANLSTRCWRIPFTTGTVKGISKLLSVNGSVATAGTFNVLILRPLWNGGIFDINRKDTQCIDLTGMPQVYDTSALRFMIGGGSSSAVYDFKIEITMI